MGHYHESQRSGGQGYSSVAQELTKDHRAGGDIGRIAEFVRQQPPLLGTQS